MSSRKIFLGDCLIKRALLDKKVLEVIETRLNERRKGREKQVRGFRGIKGF